MNSEYKYKIPRNVKQRFTLFGLTWVQMGIMVPICAVAVLLFQLFSGPPKIIIPVFLVGASWAAMTQEIDGETMYEIAKNWILDVFRPKHHYWEEVDHARYYSRYLGPEKEEGS